MTNFFVSVKFVTGMNQSVFDRQTKIVKLDEEKDLNEQIEKIFLIQNQKYASLIIESITKL
jgi:hypothetical protein